MYLEGREAQLRVLFSWPLHTNIPMFDLELATHSPTFKWLWPHYLCHHDWCWWNSPVHYHCPGMKCLAEKRNWLFWLQSCYTGCRQAEKTVVTSGSFDMIAWLGNTAEVQFR